MKAKILIIDDSGDFRAQVKDYLKMHDPAIEIFEASTAEMGVAKASCVRPDIVLMDIHLPHGNGLEATKHIKEENLDCDVIVLTMLDVEAFRQAAQNVAVTDFIGKSEIYERLMPSIERCLKISKSTTQPEKGRLIMKLGSASRRVAIPQPKSSAQQQSCCSREEQVRKIAYELYEKRGCQPGHEWEDWLEAEKLVFK